MASARRKKIKVNPRKLMEQAVEAMLQSIPESRQDGKATPMVGAVIRKPDGSIETACRGELRFGDHAEFTLLERKNRANKLDGSILFATLEPCAPGSRAHPKLSCAERIVLARIKEIWVGIPDPDPTVDRKGIQYLKNNGVTVNMFDRDLQERIQEANKEFIAQALERAAAAEEAPVPKTISLSPLEDVIKPAAIKDFSVKAINDYRSIAKIKSKVGSSIFNRRLLLQGLLKKEGKGLLPTGFGILLFGKEPRTVMPQAGLLGTIHYADGSEEAKDFIGPQVLAPAQALQWLRDKLPDPIERKGKKTQGRRRVLRTRARRNRQRPCSSRLWDRGREMPVGRYC